MNRYPIDRLRGEENSKGGGKLSEPIADKYRIVTESTEERLSEKELVDHKSEIDSFLSDSGT